MDGVDCIVSRNIKFMYNVEFDIRPNVEFDIRHTLSRECNNLGERVDEAANMVWFSLEPLQ